MTARCERGGAALAVARTPATWPAPVPVCYAYDRDGTRADACVVVSGPQTIPLDGTTCPSWFLPDPKDLAPAATPVPIKVVETLLAKGWSQLSSDEQRSVLDRVNDDPLEVAVIARLLDSADVKSVVAGATALARLESQVPYDLRKALDAWLLTKVGPRAKGLHFATAHDAQTSALLELVARAGDADLAREAKSLAANYQDLPDPPRLAVMSAAVDDLEFQKRLIVDVKRAVPDKRWEIMSALARVRDPLALLQREGDELTKDETDIGRNLLFQLLSASCDPARQKEQLTLMKKLLPGGGDVWLQGWLGECRTKRAKLEPAFRSWVGHAK